MLLDDLSQLPYFSIQEVRNLYPKTDITIRELLVRGVKNKNICRLKKGYYVTKNFISYQQDSGYKWYIGNKLIQPSYISLTTALDRYGIFSESAFGVSSICVAKPSEYRNILGSFVYRNIKESLFTGFQNKKIGNYEIAIASPAKALFDYFWYKKKTFSTISEEIFQSLRLNIEVLSKKDIKEFSIYVALSNSQKMKNIYSLLQKLCG